MELTRCETCGNDYDKAFRVIKDDEEHVFDCFECAIEALAPRCAHCTVRIIGHGLEKRGQFFCCANCAMASGESELCDRV
jgi:hypothetical protein